MLHCKMNRGRQGRSEESRAVLRKEARVFLEELPEG